MKIKTISRHEQWFKFPDDPEKGEILIREVLESDVSEIAFASVLKSGRGQESLEVEYCREYLARHIADWRNVSDEDGSPLPCNYANKMLLIGQPKMAGIIDEFVGKVTKEGAKRREDAGKN
jgi:hypothetical protein